MKYYLIAGERSGDLHASNLIQALRREDPQAEFRAWGGEQMQQAGATLVKHYRDMAFMGFWEVAKNLRTIWGFISVCQQDMLQYQPDVVILVDYAGFNLRIAKFAKQNGIRTFYYISPKVWAWNRSRAFTIKANVDRLFSILPFEPAFFQEYDYKVDYVGNPLLDAIAAFQPNPAFRQQHKLTDEPVIAVLPGSRQQEVDKMLELMLSVVPQLPDYQFVIAAVSNLPIEFYEKFTRIPHVSVVVDQTYDLLANATAALVTSGTATLETALFEVPQVVCYRTGSLSYLIAKNLIRVKYISLVNLIVDQEIVRELIQENLTVSNLSHELRKILPGSPERKVQIKGYARVKFILGQPGASQRTAQLMVRYLKEETEASG